MELDGDISVAFTLWRDGVVPSEALTEAATQALVDGLDSPSLRQLAGVPVPEAPYEAPELCERALAELGMAPADDFSARVSLARSHARSILAGTTTEFRGARAIWWAFSGDRSYPELTTEMLSLEDEWEGGWGRSEEEVKRAIRDHARRILDVWGDPLSGVHRLHSGARRWLIDEHARWCGEYAALIDRGGDRIERTGSHGWDYSEEAGRLFPRYAVIDYVLREIERTVPSDFASDVVLRSRLREGALRGFDLSHVREEPAARSELYAFLEWLDQAVTPLAPDLEPYRRTLSAGESERWLLEMTSRWGLIDAQWHPLIPTDSRGDAVIVSSQLWHDEDAVVALRDALRAQGVSVVITVTELVPSSEMVVDIFDPAYASAGEVLATSSFPWWLLYTSHEGTTALSSGPHVDALAAAIPDWDRWVLRDA